MQIYGSAPRVIDRSQWGGATYDSANRVGTHPADASLQSRRTQAVDGVGHEAALSALRNDRFGAMLEKISDPRASGTLMLGGNGKPESGANMSAAFSAYADND